MIKRIYLEITNSCNLDCPFCTNTKGQSFMSLDTIKNYLKQIKNITDYVYLHVLGEPLLHPDFNSILDYCDYLDLKVQLVTNGTLMYKYKNILQHTSLRKLSISLHSINHLSINEDYFKTINELIDNNNNKYIELRFYDNDNLDSNLNNYLCYLKKKYAYEDTTKRNSYKIKDNVYLYYSEMFKWPNIDDEIISNNGKCLGAVNQLAILHNGIVTICCLDSNGHCQIGNLNNQSLEDIINSDIYKNTLNSFKRNILNFELCKKCSYRLRFK